MIKTDTKQMGVGIWIVDEWMYMAVIYGILSSIPFSKKITVRPPNHACRHVLLSSFHIDNDNDSIHAFVRSLRTRIFLKAPAETGGSDISIPSIQVCQCVPWQESGLSRVTSPAMHVIPLPHQADETEIFSLSCQFMEIPLL